MKNRERLGSRLGFIMLSAGCAIGCGNVWKFPWMCGQNGGGSFMLLYIICLVVLGLPAMTMEFSVGRAAQASPIHMYQKLEKPGYKWGIFGIASLIGNIALMAFYTVVTGWMVYYFWKFLTGDIEGLGFVNMITNPAVNVGFLAITVAIGFFVLTFQLQGGLERVTKYMMMLLLALMLVLAVVSGMQPGAVEGYRFYLVPDFTKIGVDTIVAAMNQAFFTLSVGMGSMAIFGSYIDKERSLLGESVNVILLDSFVAIMAGLIIFPSCAAYGVEVTAGPALLFDTMAAVFKHIQGGRIWGTLFFMFMTFAAFSTIIGVFENIIASCMDKWEISRKKSSLINGIIILIGSVPAVLGYNVWKGFQPRGAGSTILDLEDFLVSNLILPGGAIVFLLFCMTKWGWGFENYLAETNTGMGLKMPRILRGYLTYVMPCIIFAIIILGLI